MKLILRYALKVIRSLPGYLLHGVIFWLPIGVIILVGGYVFSYLERLGKDVLSLFIDRGSIYAGIGTALWVAIFLLTGLLLRKTFIGNVLSDVPVVGLFFRKRGVGITPAKLKVLTPCLFLHSPTCPSYGWILSSEGVDINREGSTITLINVYAPSVPSLVTGQLYSVRKEAAIRLGNPSREIIDVLLYGLRRPDTLQYLPWDDETEDEFRHRAERFGLNLVVDQTSVKS